MKLKILLITFVILKSVTIQAQTWTPINSPTTINVNSCSFVDENTGWIISGDGIYKTIDGGTSWTSQAYPEAPAQDIRIFLSISFINENVGMISCGNYLYSGHDPDLVSSILWTNDGGENWEYKDVGGNVSYALGGVLASPLVGYAIGQYGQSKKTVDGGATWTPCTFSGIGYSGKDLFALDENHVYFAGLQNLALTAAIGRMSNSTWLITDFNGVMMQSIFFTDANTGWAAGDGGIIKRTVNGGTSWTGGNSGVTSDIYGISFKDSQHGWACTADGKILKSVNGGSNWSTEYTGTGALYKITFKNDTGYAVGGNGTLLKYSTVLHTDIPQRNEVSVYPNPTNNRINISSGNPNIKISGIYIYNAMGQIVKSFDGLDNNVISIEKGNLSHGIYYLKIESDAHLIQTTKLIVTD